MGLNYYKLKSNDYDTDYIGDNCYNFDGSFAEVDIYKKQVVRLYS